MNIFSKYRKLKMSHVRLQIAFRSHHICCSILHNYGIKRQNTVLSNMFEPRDKNLQVTVHRLHKTRVCLLFYKHFNVKRHNKKWEIIAHKQWYILSWSKLLKKIITGVIYIYIYTETWGRKMSCKTENKIIAEMNIYKSTYWITKILKINMVAILTVCEQVKAGHACRGQSSCTKSYTDWTMQTRHPCAVTN